LSENRLLKNSTHLVFGKRVTTRGKDGQVHESNAPNEKQKNPEKGFRNLRSITGARGGPSVYQYLERNQSHLVKKEGGGGFQLRKGCLKPRGGGAWQRKKVPV